VFLFSWRLLGGYSRRKDKNVYRMWVDLEKMAYEENLYCPERDEYRRYIQGYSK